MRQSPSHTDGAPGSSRGCALRAVQRREPDAESEGIAAGFRSVRHEPRLQLLIGLYGAQTFVAGAYGVLVVVVALQLLGLGSAGVGLLEAATGVGAVAGAVLALGLVGRRRTAGDLNLGLVLFGAPLILVGVVTHTWAAVVALVLVGVGNSVVDISAVTLLQRTVPAPVAGRVFGLLESIIVGGLALGSLVVPLLVHLVGVRATLVIAGAVLPVLTLLMRKPLARIDVGAAVPVDQLAAIRSVAFLDALPMQRQEALAAALTRVELAAGETLFSRDDHGDRFYILESGAVEIDLRSGIKRESAPAFVGEIALLRDVPRTATVRADSPCVLWALDRAPFLAAVAGHARSRSQADAVLSTRALVSP